MQTLWQDLRFGARMLLKKPVFTVVAVITLALCFAISTLAQSDRGSAAPSQAVSNRQKTTRKPADKQKDISPRLALLQKELKAGNSGAVLSQSGSFWWKQEGDNRHEWLTRQFEASTKLPVRFYLDVGLMERGTSQKSDPNMLTVNRRMRNVLRAKGYQLFYQEFNGGHEWANWRGTFADGLLFLAGKGRGEKDGRAN